MIKACEAQICVRYTESELRNEIHIVNRFLNYLHACPNLSFEYHLHACPNLSFAPDTGFTNQLQWDILLPAMIENHLILVLPS